MTVKELNIEIYGVLSALDFTPAIPVVLETLDGELPDEYISYQRLTGTENTFADNVNLQNYHMYRVSYFGNDKGRRDDVLQAVKEAMKATGWGVEADNIGGFLDDTGKAWGGFSEFVRVI